MSLIIVVKFTLCSLILGLVSAKNDTIEIFLTDIISDKKKFILSNCMDQSYNLGKDVKRQLKLV